MLACAGLRAADLRSVLLWRVQKLAGFSGFGSVPADLTEPGIWWTSTGLEVHRHPLVTAHRDKLRKYLVRTRHFRGTASFGTSRITGNAGGAPFIKITSIDEDDAVEECAEEGVPPTESEVVMTSTVNELEAVTGTDIDGDGDIGLEDAEEIYRPIATRVWDGREWLMNWEYQEGALGEYKGSDWTVVRLESRTSESICVEVFDPDLLTSAGGGRIGVAVMAANVGHGWQAVYDRGHAIIGHVYIEIKKKKKRPKQHVPIEPHKSPSQAKFQFVPDGKNSLGIQLSEHGVIVGYSNKGGAAEMAGVPVGSTVIQLNGVSVASKSDIVDVLERASKYDRWDLEWICELPEPDAAAGAEEHPEIDLASAPAPLTVQTGFHYDFKEELKAFNALKQLFTERVDEVILETSLDTMHEAALPLMTRCFSTAVQRAIVQRWGANGLYTLGPAEFGDLLAFLKSFLEFMASYGWKPTVAFVDVISKELLGDSADKVCLMISKQIEVWMENSLVRHPNDLDVCHGVRTADMDVEMRI